MLAKKSNLRAPGACSEHRVRGYHLSIEPEHCLLQPMPLDDTHCLWDTTWAAPVVLGDRGHFLGCWVCGDSVVNEPSFVRDIGIHVVGGAEYEAYHVGGRQ